MNLMRKTVSALGGIFMAALLIGSLAPKTTRGIAAALVQVMNTSANPVPNQDVDNPGRATIESVFVGVFNNLGSENLLGFSSFTVPAGQRFVIDQVDGSCSGSIRPGAQLLLTEAGQSRTYYLVLTPQGTSSYAFNQSVHYVADPGSGIGFSASTSDTTEQSNCAINVSGHLISYP